MADTVRLQVKLVPDTKDLERVLKKYQGQQVQVEATTPGAKGGGGTAALLGGIKSAAPVMAITTALIVIKKVLDTIHESIKDTLDVMKEVNPGFRRQEELMKKMYNMALLPMSQLMTMMLKPYLQLMMIKVKEMREKAAPLLEDWKTATPERKKEIEGELLDLYKDYATMLSAITVMFKYETAEISGTVAGFKAGLKLIFNDWLIGVDAWVKGFNEGLGTIYDIPDKIEEVALALNEAIKAGAIDAETLPPMLATLSTLFGKVSGEITDDVPVITDDFQDMINGLETFLTEMKRQLGFIQSGSAILRATFLTGFGTELIDIVDGLKKMADTLNTSTIADFGKKMGAFIFGGFGTVPGVADMADALINALKEQEETTGNVLPDFISRPGQQAQPFSSSDTIIGMKDIGKMGNGEINVTINVSGEGEEVAYKIKKELVSALYRYGRF